MNEGRARRMRREREEWDWRKDGAGASLGETERGRGGRMGASEMRARKGGTSTDYTNKEIQY